MDIQKQPGQKIIELGGGSNRHPASDVNVDMNAGPGVDFTADFDKPLPIQSNEWDGVLSIYALEHVAWRSMRQFISEVFRILKPGGKAIFVTPNIEAQVQWAQKNPNGWDGKDWFESASEIVFGSQNYGDNLHKSWLSPAAAMDLFLKAGFVDVSVLPAGARNTDMSVSAFKPVPEVQVHLKPEEALPDANVSNFEPDKAKAQILAMPREEVFDVEYFNGGRKVGGYANVGYWDFPIHEATVEALMRRKPESVLELGAARGYIGKRLEDRGVRYLGLEVSNHCWLTRVCDGVVNQDVLKTPWSVVIDYKDKLSSLGRSIQILEDKLKFDLCFSCAFLEHVPEDKLPVLIEEMQRTCKRGLHGIDFGAKDDGFDRSHCNLKPYSWWRDRMPTGHEVVDKQELEKESDFPHKLLDLNEWKHEVKLNVGCGNSLYHRGWDNIDINESIKSLASYFAYKFIHCDVRKGLNHPSGVADLIHVSHLLDFLTYGEARDVLRELRRVVKHDGLMRLACIDADDLIGGYYDINVIEEVSSGCKEAKSRPEKLWSLLGDKKSIWDVQTLIKLLEECGWEAWQSTFRESDSKKMLVETIDQIPALSFYVEAKPASVK